MNSFMMKTSMLSLAAVAVLGISGCSGSGSGDGSQNSAAKTYNGVAIDGFLSGANVCMDLNNNDECDTNEPKTTTNAKGAYSLQSDEDGSFIVVNGLDIGTGKNFTGRLLAPKGSTVVTPLTSVIQAMVKNDSTLTVATAKSSVQKALGLEGIDITSFDPLSALADTAKTANAKKVLEKQAYMQVMVHAASVAIASADDNTEIADVMGKVFTELGKNFKDASSAVTIDSEKLESATRAVANAVYVDKPEALISVHAVAKDTAVRATATAEVTATNIKEATADDIATSYNAAILIANDTLEDGVRGRVEAAKAEVEKHTPEEMLDLVASLETNEDAASAISDAIEATLTEDNKEDLAEEIKKDIEDANEAVSETERVAELISGATETVVANLINKENIEQNATVVDAKDMFRQLRETAVTFVDLDNIDTNSSAILGGQIELLNTKIKPATEKIAEDFKATATAVESSVQAFDDSLGTNFDSVLSSIENRLEELFAEADKEDWDKNWSVTVGGDTLEHTYDHNETTEVITETFTLDRQTLTIVGSVDENEDFMPTSISTSGTISLSGTGYNLSISSLSLVEEKATIKASGTITGENSATMTLSTLELELDVNPEVNDINMFQNIKATFDGEISSAGRKLVGKLSLNEGATSTLEGIYTGASGEPSFSGKVTMNGSLNTLLDDVAHNNKSSSVGSWSPLLMANVGGVTSLVTNYSYTSSYDSSTKESVYSYILTPQKGDEISCERRTSWGKNSFTCENATVTPYTTYDGIMVATLEGGKELFVNNAWTNSQWSNDVSTHQQRIYFHNTGETYYENNELMLNGEKIVITALEIRESKNLLDRAFDFSFDGNLTHGAKSLTATLGVNKGATTSELYAQDVKLTDGISHVKLDKLSVEMPAAEFVKLGERSRNNYYGHDYTPFENYEYNYNAYHDNNDNDIDAEAITKAVLSGFELVIVDEDSRELKLTTDISYTNGETRKVVFDGSYNYRGTSFVGHIDIDGTENDNDVLVGDAKVSGSIVSHGFRPFDIKALVKSKEDKSVNGYALFTRAGSYTLGIKLDHTVDAETKTTVVSLGDSRGVLGAYSSEDEILHVTNKNGDPLAEVGTTNNWEIVYSDETSETLF